MNLTDASMQLCNPRDPEPERVRIPYPGPKAAMLRIVVTLLLLAMASRVAADYETGMKAYERGDYATALHEFRPLAEQGDAAAQYKLGWMYANGNGVPEDAEQAVFWFRQAAEQGDGAAQYNLGVRYAKGEGVPEDVVRAYTWFNLAAAQGSKVAERGRAVIRKFMTSVQIAEAQKLSRALAARIAGGHGESTPSGISDGMVRPAGPSLDTVRQVQTYLALLGYDPGPVDGQPGERTAAAVQRFQRALGMTPTGRISEELLALLRLAVAARLADSRSAE